MYPQYLFNPLDGYFREERERVARDRRRLLEARARNEEREGRLRGEDVCAGARRPPARARSPVRAKARTETC